MKLTAISLSIQTTREDVGIGTAYKVSCRLQYVFRLLIYATDFVRFITWYSPLLLIDASMSLSHPLRFASLSLLLES